MARPASRSDTFVREPSALRRSDTTGWQAGTSQRMERAGSIGRTEALAAALAVPLAPVLVPVPSRRLGQPPPVRWDPFAARAARTEQLSLLPLLPPGH